MAVNKEFSNSEIKRQLGRILASEGFVRSIQLCKFLSFVVNASLSGNTGDIKGYTIATEVFGRDDSFDPQGDPIVRIEAGRLRRRLEHYYGTVGRTDPIRIDIPKGAYIPTFKQQKITTRVSENTHSDSTPSACIETESNLDMRPSVAVMPFINLNRDKDFEYFTFGLGEEITNRLSLLRGVAVVAHYSMMQYKGKTHDLKKVGRDLQVNYLITGSIYRGVDRVRLNLQLSESQTNRQLWSMNFETPLSASKLIELQDKILKQVVASVADHYGAFNQSLWKASKRNPMKSLSAYEAVLRYYHWNMYPSSEAQAIGRKAMKHAVTLDPENAEVWAILGETHCDAYIYVGNDDNPLDSAAECVHKALTLDPNCQYGYYTKSFLHVLQKDRESAIQGCEHLVTLNPDAAFMLGAAGVWLGLACEYERGMEYIQRSIKMGPAFPGWFHFIPFASRFREGNYDEAFLEAKKIYLPKWFWDPLVRAATLGQLDLRGQAHEALKELLAIMPNFGAEADYFIHALLMDDVLIEGLFEGLYKAGLSKS